MVSSQGIWFRDIKRNLSMKNLLSVLVVGLILGLVGCGDAKPGDAAEDHSGHTHGEGEGHDAGEHKDGEEVEGGDDDKTSKVAAVCPISGKDLGSMGEPVVKTYEGKEVKFCCAGCVAPYEKKLAAAKAEAAKIEVK